MSTSGIDSNTLQSSLDSLSSNSSLTSPAATSLSGATDNTEQVLSGILQEATATIAATQDTVNVGVKDLYKSLTVLGQKVLSKLQEILGKDLPDGIASLKPEDHTPEKTAQNIVDGTTALFNVFAKQHSELDGEALISEFMKTIRGGIQQGYSEADSILGEIGAYQIDGVQSGIEETKKLVEQKLQAFEDNYRRQNGLTVATDSNNAPAASDANVAQPTSVNATA